MKSEHVNDNVETCCLLMDELLNSWSNNTINLFLKPLFSSNLISSSSLDNDELEQLEWWERFNIRIFIIKKHYVWDKSITT